MKNPLYVYSLQAEWEVCYPFPSLTKKTKPKILCHKNRTFCVEGEGFEPAEDRSRQIYSLAHLTALIPFQKLSDNFTTNTQLFEE